MAARLQTELLAAIAAYNFPSEDQKQGPSYVSARLLEEAIGRVIRSHFPEAQTQAKLPGIGRHLTDFVFSQREGSTFAVECLLSPLPEQRRAIPGNYLIRRIRETWGTYQPLVHEGRLSYIIMITNRPLQPNELDVIKLYKSFIHVLAEDLDYFLSKIDHLSTDLIPVPTQVSGPHFGINEEGALFLSETVDGFLESDNKDRIQTLLPLLRRCTDDLKSSLNNTDAFSALKRSLDDYSKAISPDASLISWGLIYGLGIFLDQFAEAAARDVSDRLQPSLEDADIASLKSLLVLHGNLVLATTEGRELQQEADLWQQTQQSSESIAVQARTIADTLRRHPETSEASVAQLLADASEAVERGRHPERAGTFGLATVKNISVVVISAAFIASFAPIGFHIAGARGAAVAAGTSWTALEVLKKSNVFQAAMQALGRDFDNTLDVSDRRGRALFESLRGQLSLLREIEDPLRSIVESFPSLRWMTTYLDRLMKAIEPPEEIQDSIEDIDG